MFNIIATIIIVLAIICCGLDLIEELKILLCKVENEPDVIVYEDDEVEVIVSKAERT